jgi:predicted nucleic acid-binding protein
VTPAIPNLQARLSGSRGALVDSNVVLGVATNDPHWGDWWARALSEVAERTTLIINPIVYAEVSIGYTKIEDPDAVLPAALYRREPLPWEAAFLAGKSFLLYRRRGGSRNSPLPDFYIGAHGCGYRGPCSAHARCLPLSHPFPDSGDTRPSEARCYVATRELSDEAFVSRPAHHMWQ